MTDTQQWEEEKARCIVTSNFGEIRLCDMNERKPEPVIFEIERIDIPENDEEREWPAKQNFRNTAEDAYTG